MNTPSGAKKAVKTRRERHGRDVDKINGGKTSGNKNPWLKGNSDNARKAVNARWSKYYELKAEQYEMEAKEAIENYKDQRGENQ